MINQTLFHFESLFFWMGAFEKPHNPKEFPDSFPFSLELNSELGILSQKKSTELESLLRKTYAFGSTVGNAMDDSKFGREYAEDFLAYLHCVLKPNCKVLEIGAGRGYLASRLKQLGYHVTALEPGEINRSYWKKYDIDIIQDVFPSKKIEDLFDAIIFYGVLEHIFETGKFLQNIHEHLAPNGIVVLSVPDCAYEIEVGDPSILLHEHFHYFTVASLQRCLAAEKFVSNVQMAGYGRTLYATAKVGQIINNEVSIDELLTLRAYPEKFQHLIEIIHEKLIKKTRIGSLGVYCPSRALSLLPTNIDVSLRFFDDAPELHGKYYPPFKIQIESREELFSRHPDELWIMSRTFGDKLKKEISPKLPNTKIFTVDEIISSAC